MLSLLAALVGCDGGNGNDPGQSGPAAPPVIVLAPQNTTVPDGSTANFTVSASGTGLGYQWQRNGAAIAGATSATHTTPASTLADSGASYTVAVSNAQGSVTSAAAVLTVTALVPGIVRQPQAVAVVTGQTARFNVQVSGSPTLAYQWLRNGAAIAGATGADHATPPAQQADDGALYSVTVSNAAGQVTSAAVALSVSRAPVPPAITVAPQDLSVAIGQPATFSVTASGTAPLGYQWLRNGIAVAGATEARYTTSATTLADSGASFTVRVGNVAGEAVSPAAVLTVLPPAPAITQQPAGISVVAGQAATFNVVVSGTGTLSYQWSRQGVPIGGATQPSFTLAATALSDNGATFTVAVGNAGGTTVSAVATLNVAPAPVPPTITAQPQAQTVPVGQAATFAVTATGTPPFTYRWQRNGSDIAGATASSYTTPAATLADSGASFQVVVGNATAITATSAPAALTVVADGPAISAQPQSATVLVGRPATFTVAASSANGPLRYQWRRGNADIAGETGPSYTLQRTVFADHGARFSVLVRDARGALLSDSVGLSVSAIAVDHVVGAARGLLSRNADGSVWLIWDAPGLNSNPYTLTPILLRDSSGFVRTGFRQVAGGRDTAVAVDDAGGVWAWGSPEGGALGNGLLGNSSLAPVPIRVTNPDASPLVGATAVQAGWLTGYALMADGTVRAWGGNGDDTGVGTGISGTAAARALPVLTAAGTPLGGVVRVATSPFSSHAMALRSDGSLWVWGRRGCAPYTGISACLTGDGSAGFSTHALQVRKPDGSAVLAPRAFATGTYFSAVVQSDGSVLAWGANGQGQLGDGTTASRNGAALMRRADGAVFDSVVAVATAVGYSAGMGGCTVLLRADGTVWATGDNTWGCVGDGTSVNRTTPVAVLDVNDQPLTGVIELSAAWSGLVAKKADGSFWAWGDVTSNANAGNGSAYVWRRARQLTGFTP